LRRVTGGCLLVVGAIFGFAIALGGFLSIVLPTCPKHPLVACVNGVGDRLSGVLVLAVGVGVMVLTIWRLRAVIRGEDE
jgi:hypothetical protein